MKRDGDLLKADRFLFYSFAKGNASARQAVVFHRLSDITLLCISSSVIVTAIWLFRSLRFIGIPSRRTGPFTSRTGRSAGSCAGISVTLKNRFTGYDAYLQFQYPKHAGCGMPDVFWINASWSSRNLSKYRRHRSRSGAVPSGLEHIRRKPLYRSLCMSCPSMVFHRSDSSTLLQVSVSC